MKNTKKQMGFTYVELLGGLAVLGTLAAMAIPNYFKSDLAIKSSMASDAKAMIHLQTNFYSVDSYFMEINKRTTDDSKLTVKDSLDNKLSYTVSDKNKIEVKPILCSNGIKGYVLLVTNPIVTDQVQYDSCEGTEPALVKTDSTWISNYTKYDHYTYLATKEASNIGGSYNNGYVASTGGTTGGTDTGGTDTGGTTGGTDTGGTTGGTDTGGGTTGGTDTGGGTTGGTDTGGGTTGGTDTGGGTTAPVYASTDITTGLSDIVTKPQPTYTYPNSYVPAVSCGNVDIESVSTTYSGWYTGNKDSIVESSKGSSNVTYYTMTDVSGPLNLAKTSEKAFAFEVNGTVNPGATLAITGSIPVTMNIDGNTTGSLIGFSAKYAKIDIDGDSGKLFPTYSGNSGYACIRINGSYSADNFIFDMYDHIVFINQNMTTDFYGGKDMDILEIKGNATGLIQLGHGTNALKVNGILTGNAVGGNNQDQFIIGNMVNGGVALADGNDNFYVGAGTILNFSAGAGNDVVYIGGSVTSFLNMDGGDDILQYNGTIYDVIDGGTGTDSIFLGNYTVNDYVNNKDSIKTRIVNFENIVVKDGVILGSLTNVNLQWNPFTLVQLVY